ncbi:E3 ubiquitin-protein ligase RBBP6 isoform X1 [Pieris brassicae]|uniref:E3 ubiquitin-protein ligase RBBP6 isoform X1 n=1 Tax=Pieris brassicae TaxID=7116 RepID=UPI001E66213F|nr:E3 ubiquitin-protein ligase RBBP6 isoform X1 [Pieris brassicae]
MSVHYKFKSALDYDTVTFDGLHISVGDLKAAISQQKRIGKTSDFDLQITNAQTKEVYVDDGTLIPKNTSLLVARVPLAQQPKKQWDNNNSQGAPVKDVSVNKGVADLSRMEGSEQDKINAMITQSTFDYDPSNYQKIRGQNQRGAVPSNYICFKCQNRGHWIKDCPVANSSDPIEIRRSSGIPRSFMVPVDGPKAPGAMMTPSGTFAVPAVDREAYLASESAIGPETLPNTPAAPEPTIPDELICSLCRDLLTDAVMIPCCGNSFCDECIRGALLESEDHECPDCREKEIAPTTLIPNRFLRNSVSSFRNQTGYSRRAPHRPSAAQPAQQKEQAPAPSASPKNSANDAVEERGGRRDESDGSVDDNITVTVPPAHTQGPAPPRPRYEHRSRYGPPKTLKIEIPPNRSKDEQRSSTPTIDERRDPNIPPQGVYNRGPIPFIPPQPHYGAPPPYGRPMGRPYPERFPHHDPYQPPPPGIKDSPNGRSEDPLEAFNRMIREKEMRAKRREEERRRVKSGSRSLSRSPRLQRLSRSPRPLRGSRSPRLPRASRSPRPPRGSPSPRPLRVSRSPRPLRDSRSPRPPRGSRSPRARPRSRGSSRLRYSRSRSLSRGRLRRSPWSPRRRRSRDRSVSLSRSPSPRRRIRSPLRYRSALRSPVGRSPLRSVVRTPLRSPLRSPPRSPPRGAARSPRQMSPHRFTGVYDELLSPPRRSEPSFGGRYGPRNNVGPTFPPLGAKPVPLMGLNLQPQPEVPPPGYRGRFDPSFDDIPPGVDPPVPGFEPPPFEKAPFGPPGTERDRLPPSNFREPYRPPAYADGTGSYRDAPVAPISNDAPPLHLDHPRYRDNFRGGAPYRDGGPLPYRDGQPYRDQGVAHRDANYRGGPSQFRETSFRSVPYRDGNYRDNIPPNFRESSLTFRPPSADPREQIPPFHDPNYREGFRDDTSRDGRQAIRSNNSSRRTGSRREKDRSRERYPDGREIPERTERPRANEKSRESRDERVRDYDRTRDIDKDRHEHGSQENKGRSRDVREKHRSESRGRSRERESKRDRKEDRGRDKSPPEKSKDHKDKDKKVKDRKKKKREKEKEREIEKKKKRDKKEKKEKENKKDDDGEQKEIQITEHNKVEEIKGDAEKKESKLVQPSSDENENVQKLVENIKVDLYGDETAAVVDKEITESYVKSETGDNNEEVKESDTANKEEPFDGIELQPAADELTVDMEIPSSNNKEVLAPLPELSKWEVDDDNQEKSKEPGEITSPDEKSDSKKVTSEVIKRAEKAIFAKAINSLRPIEIKKISSDRVKLYGDDQPKPTLNNIQITVPVTELERKTLESSDKQSRNSKTPPPRISVKDRLGGKVENVHKGREPRVVHSTVERVKSRSKTPSIRRVTLEKERSRKSETRNIGSKDRNTDRRVKTDNIKGENYHDKKKEKLHGDRKVNDEKLGRSKINDNSEFNSTNDKERKKSTLDEAHFEPDYDENVESETDTKEESSKKRERSASPGPTPTKKPKIENETIKLDLTNVRKRPDTDTASSSSDDSSSSSSSDGRKRKKKKKRTKKKKKRAASDSESESDSSSEDHKKKKKKRKHKKKSSKKKKKSKHK